MRKNVLLGIMMAALLLPGAVMAEVAAGAGNITLLGHIDFVGRYSAEDEDEGWNGYETYNLEFAVLGIAGTVGDNVDWVITQAFAFTGPFGSLNSEAGEATNDEDAALLDARINWHMTDSLTLSAGRFIPPTSMTWNPHLLKGLCTINYPLLNGGGLQGSQITLMDGKNLFIPMPMYQTGVMLTGSFGPTQLMVGHFNGNDIYGGAEGLIDVPGLNNTMDIDKTKGTLVKITGGSGGMHAGVWYYAEEVSIKPDTSAWRDSNINQWGIELAQMSESYVVQFQYLSTVLDPEDDGADDLEQSGWYLLVGGNVGPVQVVARYDYFDYDMEEALLDTPLLVSDKMNEESATVLGFNYNINANTILGLNYTWRNVEDWDANTDELSMIIEMNLF